MESNFIIMVKLHINKTKKPIYNKIKLLRGKQYSICHKNVNKTK